jgi:hypothetical protein
MLGEAATAAGLKPYLLKTWIDRSPAALRLGAFDQQGGGTGRPRLLTLRRVICAGVAAELVALGLIASRAGELAFQLTDVEVPRYSEAGEIDPKITLVVYADGDVRVEPQNIPSEKLFSRGNKAGAALLVSLPTISQRVRNRLTRIGKSVGPIG